ncbi:MAG: PAS domain-containing protein [Bacteriovoracaceae bacterium]|jgi:PAS domain-containing protein
MKLSRTPFLALVSIFLLANILVTSLIIQSSKKTAPSKPYKNIVESYWLESDTDKQNQILTNLYPEVKRDFPQLVQTHKFFIKNNLENQSFGTQTFSELTLRMFSLFQYVKRKNWLTLERMSFQTIQHYSSALEKLVTSEKLDFSKVFRFTSEIKELTMNSRLSNTDKKIVVAKVNKINADLNKVEDYIGKKLSLKKINNELNNDLSSLAQFEKEPGAFILLDGLTNLPFSTIKVLAAQYLISGFLFFGLLGLYRSKGELSFEGLFEDSPIPTAFLNKKGQFIALNDSFKDILPYTNFSHLKKLTWDSFQKLARIEFKTPVDKIEGALVSSATLDDGENRHDFMVRLTPNKKLGGFCLSLYADNEIQVYQELSAVPDFLPPTLKEDVNVSHLLEDVIAELSNLFQSKQIELSLNIKGDKHKLYGDIEKTKMALKDFIRDLVFALAPKSKTKRFILSLEETLDGIVLNADMDDIKLATPVLKSNFKFEEEGKTKKRNLNQGIDILRNSGLGFDIDLNFKNNFDINNKFTGSNISIEMRN